MGKVGSSSLVFLVNLSIEQSISQRHKHKIIGYTALFCMSTWKSQCRREAGSAGVTLRVSSERSRGRNLAPLFPAGATRRHVGGGPAWFVFQLSGKTGCEGSGDVLGRATHAVLSPVPSPSAGVTTTAPSPRGVAFGCNSAALVPCPHRLWVTSRWVKRMHQRAKRALSRERCFFCERFPDVRVT